jgi:YD repeat-containing protein
MFVCDAEDNLSKLSRLVKAELPDGNVIELRYNGYHDVLHAQDKHTEVSYTYTLGGGLSRRL